ncbi:hypothetical protein [Argonema antarcticum]|uniref:hypothetical protein n=1 Tax=Argonema antarcticum TaxID=2942763 RepID=UPI002012B927|nr:hypothetical protein [Argonema antarcticum]MCL1474992.1 hypothetical protein [Argonema antarcticum A004/B2]
MVRIREVVQEALTTGYLTVKAEENLRLLLQIQYDSQDFDAFMTLQQAASSGCVMQESRSPSEFENLKTLKDSLLVEPVGSKSS